MASVAISIKVKRRIGPHGVKKIIRNLPAATDKAASDFAHNTTSGAQRRCHVITGRLRKSIHTIKRGPGSYTSRVGAFYGVYEERGTRYRPPHPFFQPAAIAAKAQFHRDIRKVFRP